ncbi:MAG: carbohydrate binding family 9 domain-containing protein [Gemmatimonadota bacterium]|jgi:hypothetical protein|nr:carbohydrate binding family 9 domain-containing protein [Gemmatimonadota bacterium]
MKHSLVVLSCSLPLLVVTAMSAQSPHPQSGTSAARRLAVQTARVASVALVIDGKLNEDAWATAEVATGFIQNRPTPGAPASERTEARILYNDEALYVGLRMYDSRPDSIVGQLGRRDREVYSDWVYVALDSYADRRTAFVFGVNPRGVQRDYMITNDIQENPRWDAVWQVATQVDSLGWTAEFRIPMSQLRFSTSKASQAWGVNFRRRLARRDELSYWAPVPPDASGIVSRFGELRGLHGLRAPQHLEILPYAVSRLTAAPGSASDPFYSERDFGGSVGADLKYGLTSDFTLTATLNPDFGQVEADPAEVNLTQFETFLSERRPFFLEGADIFSLSFPEWPPLFYSRRIGRAPQGRLPAGAVYADVPERTTILGAAKLTGKTAKGLSVGLLSALTAPERARYADETGIIRNTTVEPLTSYSIARAVKDWRNGQSAIGGVFTATHRRIEDDLDFLRSNAYTGGVDARHRFGEAKYEIKGALLGTLVTGSDSAIARTQRAPGHGFQRVDARHLTYDPARTRLSGISTGAELSKVEGGNWRWGVAGLLWTPGYEANDLGFQPQADVVRQRSSLGYVQFEPSKHFLYWTANLVQATGWTTGGEPVDSRAQVNGGFQLRNRWAFEGGVNRDFSTFTVAELRGGPALRRPGSTAAFFNLAGDRRGTLIPEVGGFLVVADEGTGHAVEFAPGVSFRPSTRAEFTFGPTVAVQADEWQYVARRSFEGEPHYLLARLDQTTVALTGRVSYTFTPNLSLQFYAQPFVSAGAYSNFKEVRDPKARTFGSRFREFSEGELLAERQQDGSRTYRIDLNGDNQFDVSFPDPDFNVKQLRSNAVLRWEYRPGSTLFVVWSQSREHYLPEGSFGFGRDFSRLLGFDGQIRVEPTNVLLLKVNYWLGP